MSTEPSPISGNECMVLVLLGQRGDTGETSISKGATSSATRSATRSAEQGSETIETSVLPNGDTLSLLEMDGDKVKNVYPLCVGNEVRPSTKPSEPAGWSKVIIMSKAMEPVSSIQLGAELKLGYSGKKPNAQWQQKSVTAWALFKDEETALVAISKNECLNALVQLGPWNFDPGDCTEADHDPLGCYPNNVEDIKQNRFPTDYNDFTSFKVAKAGAFAADDKTLKGDNQITPVKSFPAVQSCSSLHQPLLKQKELMMIYIKVQTKDIKSNTDMKEDVCPICFQSFDDEETVWMQCGHAVHAQCHAGCLAHGHTQCSVCRKQSIVAGTGCGKRSRSPNPV